VFKTNFKPLSYGSTHKGKYAEYVLVADFDQSSGHWVWKVFVSKASKLLDSVEAFVRDEFSSFRTMLFGDADEKIEEILVKAENAVVLFEHNIEQAKKDRESKRDEFNEITKNYGRLD